MTPTALTLHKPTVIRALLAAAQRECAAVERVAAMARDEASSEESKSEGKYDTRATEASYLARGQAERVAELRRARSWLEVLEPLPCSQVQVGALVKVSGRRVEWLFVAPMPAISVEVGESGDAGDGPGDSTHTVSVRTISLSSPLGSAMIGLSAGDEFDVEGPQGVMGFEVLEVG